MVSLLTPEAQWDTESQNEKNAIGLYSGGLLYFD